VGTMAYALQISDRIVNQVSICLILYFVDDIRDDAP
jgi:hypothetical protein